MSVVLKAQRSDKHKRVFSGLDLMYSIARMGGLGNN